MSVLMCSGAFDNKSSSTKLCKIGFRFLNVKRYRARIADKSKEVKNKVKLGRIIAIISNADGRREIAPNEKQLLMYLTENQVSEQIPIKPSRKLIVIP